MFKKHWQRAATALLSLVLICCLCTASAMAADTQSPEGFSLYNGALLPDLPDDVGTLPYAYINTAMGGTAALLCLCEDPFVYNGSGLRASYGTFALYMYDPQGIAGTPLTDWTFQTDGLAETVVDAAETQWANHNIVNSNGGVYLMGSDPVDAGGDDSGDTGDTGSGGEDSGDTGDTGSGGDDSDNTGSGGSDTGGSSGDTEDPDTDITVPAHPEYAENTFAYVMGLCWDLLSFKVPGMGEMDAKTWVIILVIINITLAALSFAFGLGGNGTGYRSGNSRRKHISKERQGDEY